MVEMEKQLRRLEMYDGENYMLVQCRAKVGDGDASIDAWTFVWNGTGGELEEDGFDASMSGAYESLKGRYMNKPSS
jgi:hypothetical protein